MLNNLATQPIKHISLSGIVVEWNKYSSIVIVASGDENSLWSVLYNPVKSLISLSAIICLTLLNAIFFLDLTSLTIDTTLSTFSDGVYQILNVNEYRSGLQNGYFTFEVSNIPGQQYMLTSGFYELSYHTYMTVKINPSNINAYLGTSFTGENPLNSILFRRNSWKF